ncbi:MAG TPA: hypothetical protein G4O00_13715 [Thermoflexia bacterium]|nr:hypothetical protein [Thermoflexia bacterium]
MPFWAYDPEEEEWIDILAYREPKEELAGRKLVCPHCGVEMVIRHGPIVIQHFAHRMRCPYADWRKPTTPEHHAAVTTLIETLSRDPFWGVATIEPGRPLPAARRIPDVLATFPDGLRVAHECQISPITPYRLDRRTAAYIRARIPVFWWFRAGYLDARPPDLKWTVLAWQRVILELGIVKPPPPDPAGHAYHTMPTEVRLLVRFPDRPEVYRLDGSQGLPSWVHRRAWQWVLWMPVYDMWRGIREWYGAEAVYRHLGPVWRERFTPEDVEGMLVGMWEIGVMAAGPEGRWMPQYLPDFDFRHWSRWLRGQRGEEGLQESPSILSVRYHCEWWTERLEGATTPEELRGVGEQIRLTEHNPEVRERLRPVYRRRMRELKRRGDGPRMGGI